MRDEKRPIMIRNCKKFCLHILNNIGAFLVWNRWLNTFPICSIILGRYTVTRTLPITHSPATSRSGQPHDTVSTLRTRHSLALPGRAPGRPPAAPPTAPTAAAATTTDRRDRFRLWWHRRWCGRRKRPGQRSGRGPSPGNGRWSKCCQGKDKKMDPCCAYFILMGNERKAMGTILA